MNNTTDTLTVSVSADTEEFVEDVEEAREAVEDLEAALRRLDDSLERLEGRDVGEMLATELRSYNLD